MTIRASCVIPAAGAGSRFGGETPKQFLPLSGVTVLRRSVLAAAAAQEIEAIAVAAPAELLERAREETRGIAKVAVVVAGGATRVESVSNALSALGGDPEVVVVHDAARPLASPALFSRTIASAAAHGGAIAAVRLDDTIKRAAADGKVLETVPREGLWRVQTPQAFRAALLREAHARARAEHWDATDDAALVERVGGRVEVVEGEPMNFKITAPGDFSLAEKLLRGTAPRVGFGRDKHPLVAGRPFRMGGIEIAAEAGPQGHSDGDALCHAIADAILGAAAAGDIGGLFPDDRDETAGISGPAILEGVRARAASAGWLVTSVDATVWTRRPKLAAHVPAMREAIARALAVPLETVSVKAKSGNGIDAVGRGEAVEAEAVVLLARS
jgi:2-C-methyl-D-erythritol 4-phosphate cytidylyltransferase/2-C-methyl-D-erythritol 2,4-cyclodiphosphate synthase